MSTFLSVRALLEEGLPKKTIARRLGLDPRTVRRYARCFEEGADARRRAAVPCKLDGHAVRVEEMARHGLTATQIYQDFCRAGVEVSYPTVRRLVRTLRRTEPEVYCRMRYCPGEAGQVDFGEIARIRVDGVERRVYLFVLTLCWSRYAYYELVLDQTVPTFLGAIRRAFEYFGGAPERLRPDNLKAAVLLDALGQRYYQEDFYRLCRHYGTLPDAARPHTPTDKGRCERDIGYAKGNCFNGREFVSLKEAKAYLVWWREEVANVRLHGTTHRRPLDLFAEERSHLRPLPAEPYEICEWGLYRVRKDCHFALLYNHYSVPHRFVGEKVLVRLSADTVTVFAGGTQVTEHERLQGRGRSSTVPEHYPVEKRLATQEIHRRRVLAVRGAGPHAAEYASRLLGGRYVASDQMARLARLVATHGDEAVDLACRRALYYDAAGNSVVIERILERGLQERPLPETRTVAAGGVDFPRPLEEYAELLGAGEVR